MKVAVLGPAGTYSSEAARQRFPESEPVFCTSLAEVVEKVGAGECAHGVLPVENSTNGSVDLAVAALVGSPRRHAVAVDGDVRVPIRHQLYSAAPTLAPIRTVYSHPQVWGQTRRWLAEHLPDAALVNADSTSSAVTQVMQRRSPMEAAIGGPGSAAEAPLVENCCDDTGNTTRFLVLRHTRAEGGGKAPPPMMPAVGPARVHALLPNTTLDAAIRALGGAKVLFLAAVPATGSWQYNVYVDVVLAPGAGIAAEILGVAAV